jgi:hypothetical protein
VSNGLEALTLTQLIHEYGEACADLFWQNDRGYGRAVDRAEQYHQAVVDELRRRGHHVGYFSDPA